MSSSSESYKVNVKVVMLGKEFGGKTCLVERFLFNQWSPEGYRSTVAAEYKAKRVEVDGRYVIVGIWDTAGSERYHSMSRIYYRDAYAALVCYDLTEAESWKRVQFWVNDLVQNRPECIIYFCGTKQDLLETNPRTRKVTPIEVMDFAKSLSANQRTRFYETSAKSGYNVEEVFLQVARDYLTDDTVGAHHDIDQFVRLDQQQNDKCVKKKCCG